MKIEDKNFTIEIIQGQDKIVFSGNLRLQSVEKYNEILDMILSYSKETANPLTIDLSKLEFINSSGIASLGIFFIKMRDIEKKIKIIASNYIKWHIASLQDFQNINPNIEIEYVIQH